MIPSAAAIHRGKHFDLLLARELAAIEREHEQNLITHQKLEKSIRRDNNRRKNFPQKKLSISIDENSNEQSEKSYSSVVSSNFYSQNQTQINQALPQIFRRYHRLCFKAQRLPPIVKFNRKTRENNELNWINFRRTNMHNENDDGAFTVLIDELPKISLPESTAMQKRIHSFMEILPTYKGVQRGFDNFAPSSLYSRRAPVAMR
jgi:hypothetical protein